MKVYKLTDENNKTHGNTLWGENISHEVSGLGELCSRGWLHYYSDPHLALILNPLHANFSNPKLWEAQAEGEIKSDKGLKFGCQKLTTIKEIPLPQLTATQLVAFAILCARASGYKSDNFDTWANNWLSGADRTAEAAAQAAWAAWAAAEAAARAAEAAWAAWAAEAAEAAAWAARAAARATEAAAWAAARAAVARAAAEAARAAAEAEIDFISIVKQALEF